MAREIKFVLKKKEYTAAAVKVDRSKLYGWTGIVALDDKGEPCQLATADESGRYLIPRGGSGLGVLTAKGAWVDRSTLITVNPDGTPAELIPSSFKAPVALEQKVTTEEFLNYSIQDFYELENIPAAMVRAVGKDIYRFDFTYLDSYETTPAFVLAAAGSVFMMIALYNRVEMLCFGESEPLDDYDDDMDLEDGDDDLDFSMFG